MSLSAFVKRSYRANLGSSVRYNMWPVCAGTGAAASGGVQISSGAAAWGASVNVMAANDIAIDHWLVGACLNTLAGGAVQVMEFQVIGAAAVAIIPVVSSFVIDPTAVTPNVGPISFLYPVFRPANAATCARAGGAAIRTIYIGLMYATLL